MIKKRSGFFETPDQAELYYEIHGESNGDKRPPLVLTYGLACLFNHWHFQVEEFSKDHQVILYDLRGHHKSSSGTLEPTVDLLASDAVGLLKFLGHEKASFWGHSFGVPISLRIGSLFPQNTESLVLINGFMNNPFSEIASHHTLIQLLDYLHCFSEAAPEFSHWIWKQGINNFLTQYLAGVTGGFNLERVPFKDIEIYSKGVSAIPIPTFCQHFSSLLEFDGAPFLSKTEAPTLIFHGLRDGLIPLSQSEDMNAGLNNSTLVCLSEGSHCSQLDLPNKINSKIRSFLYKKT